MADEFGTSIIMKFLTEETPGKVMGLLGTAVASMFFLFAVTTTNASFSQTEKSFPTAFNPNQVVATLDNVASDYSKFFSANLVEPAQDSYAVFQYNLAYVIDEASPSILAMTGLSGLADVQQTSAPVPQVAGDSTQVVYSNLYPPHSGSVFSVFFGN